MAAPSNQSDQLVMAPALTVWGETRMLDPDFETRDMVPNWEEVSLPGTGHFLMMEQPEAFNAILREFIEDRAEF
jgi:pimeloyl-ACP methyl ester carboxylesterase